MRCNLLREIYERVVVPKFDEGLVRGGIFWSLKAVPSYERGRAELSEAFQDTLAAIRGHVGDRGQIESLNISWGEVEDRGARLGVILCGRLIRGLCYLHATQCFIRLYLKSLRSRLVLTMYGDLLEDTPWLTEVVDPRSLRIALR